MKTRRVWWTPLLSFLVIASALRADAGEWVAIGPPGAPVKAVVANPVTETLHAAAHGVFTSDDAATTWMLAAGSPSFTRLAVAPEAASTLWGVTPGVGLAKSVDGSTWVAVATGFDDAINAVAPHPSMAATVYAGAAGRILKTIDGGSTWSVVYGGCAIDSYALEALAVAPSGSVYASVPDAFCNRIVVRSDDGGSTWTPVTPPPMIGVAVQVFHFAFDPLTPGTVYAAGARAEDVLGSLTIQAATVYKSVDSGGTWTEAHPPLEGVSDYPVDAIVVDPLTPSTVYLTTARGVYKSVDGALSWSLHTGVIERTLKALAIDPTPPATLYAGSPLGVVESADGGVSWHVRSAGMHQSNVRALVADRFHAGALLATSDGVPQAITTDGGATWDLGSGLPERANIGPERLAAAPSIDGLVYALDGASASLHRSTDGGRTFSAARTFVDHTLYSLAIDPTDANRLYVGGEVTAVRCGGAVWRTANGGGTWFRHRFVVGFCGVNTIAVDPSNPARVYDGHTFAGVAYSDDYAASWQSTPNVGIPYGDVMQVLVDPATPANIYALWSVDVGVGGRLYRSTNAGAQWTLASALGINVTALALDPAVPTTLYAAIENEGVRRSLDGGVTWSELGMLPTPLRVSALRVDPFDAARVYAATDRHGVMVFQPVCGDGLVDGDEACDDGNAADGDCCSSTCTVINTGQPCSDGNLCTLGDVCSAGACGGTPQACDPCEVCSPASGCMLPTSPACAMAAPGKASIGLKRNPLEASKDVFGWKLASASDVSLGDFGSPLTATDVTLCLIDGAGVLRMSLSAPAAGLCAGKACWMGKSSGYKYGDKDATPDGVTGLSLKPGVAGKAKMQVKGKGSLLAMPALPFASLPITARLVRSDGPQCWEARFAQPLKNDAGAFKAKSE